MNNSYNERSMKIIDLKKTILEDNDADADRLREELKKKNVFYMNVMSSPGSGKTTTIVGTIERLKEHFNIGVMEADIDSDVDALTVAKAGVPAVQLHTGGMCHLDADMSRQGMAALEAEADNTLDFLCVRLSLIQAHVLMWQFFQFRKEMINRLSIHLCLRSVRL
mgnify:CR=1 FL=1